jgi:hypothetical protein
MGLPPLGPRGETHSLAGRGGAWGDPFQTKGQTRWYSMYFYLYTIIPLRFSARGLKKGCRMIAYKMKTGNGNVEWSQKIRDRVFWKVCCRRIALEISRGTYIAMKINNRCPNLVTNHLNNSFWLQVCFLSKKRSFFMFYFLIDLMLWCVLLMTYHWDPKEWRHVRRWPQYSGCRVWTKWRNNFSKQK